MLAWVLQLFGTGIQAQNTGWQQWEKIYSDSYITVELQYYYSNSGCDPNGKQFKYRGRVTGKYRTSSYFVNFKMDYIDCNGNLYWQELNFPLWSTNGETVNSIMVESMDYRFSAASLDVSFYEVEASSNKISGSGVKRRPMSSDPSAIEGRTTMFYGEKNKLTVKGGSLGIGADWVWYQDACGTNRIGTGPEIQVSPTENATYFVRAEGSNNTTNCASIRVSVDKRSSDPSLIQGKTEICKGDNAQLSVGGGSLGLDAMWVWYTDGCGAKKVGMGSTLSIQPNQPTTYYVRAESPYNTTNCAKLSVNVVNASVEPKSIVANLSGGAVCLGEPVSLRVKGGELAERAVWAWYSSSCGSNRVGTGESITHKPYGNTTYYVRAEGVCNTTNCATLLVPVTSVSTNPGSIIAPTSVYKGKKTTLTVSGGTLGKGADWQWYKGSCAGGDPIGKGSTITIRPRKKGDYSVQAKGMCNTTRCVSVSIDPIKTHKFERTYNARAGNKKFFHFGFGLGAEWQRISDIADVSRYNSLGNFYAFDTATIQIDGYGLRAEIGFHPIIKEYLSIGVMGSGSIGTSWPDGSSSGTKTSYTYTRLQLNSELAFGFKKMKFLFKLDKTIQPNDYSQKPTGSFANQSAYSYDRTVKTEALSAGFRFGRYTRTKYGKRGDCVDLVYVLTRDNDNAITEFDFDTYNNFSAWKVGTGFVWWRQSKFKFQFDIRFNTTQEVFNIGSPDFENAGYNLSLIWNRNLFY